MQDDTRDEVWGYVKEAIQASQELGSAFRDRSLSPERLQEISRTAITTEAVARAAIYQYVRGEE